MSRQEATTARDPLFCGGWRVMVQQPSPTDSDYALVTVFSQNDLLRVGNGIQQTNWCSIIFCAEARRWQWNDSATPANGCHVGALAQTVELLADILGRRLALGSVFAAQLMGMLQQFPSHQFWISEAVSTAFGQYVPHTDVVACQIGRRVMHKQLGRWFRGQDE